MRSSDRRCFGREIRRQRMDGTGVFGNKSGVPARALLQKPPIDRPVAGRVLLPCKMLPPSALGFIHRMYSGHAPPSTGCACEMSVGDGNPEIAGSCVCQGGTRESNVHAGKMWTCSLVDVCFGRVVCSSRVEPHEGSYRDAGLRESDMPALINPAVWAA